MHVIDSNTSYNILLGRSWIHENKVVSSTYHHCFKYFEDGVHNKVVADDEPFTKKEAHFADAKFYLKDYVSMEVKVKSSIPIRKADVIKKVDVETEKVGVMTKKNQLLSC